MTRKNALHISSLSKLSKSEVAKLVEKLSNREADELFYNWEFVGRKEQHAPPGEWQYWLLMAGRGFGKTRTGAEWVRKKIKEGFGRGALIAPTSADARDVMVEGPAGVCRVAWKHDRDINGNSVGIPRYEPSKRRVTWENGATVTLFSAEEPDRLRGPQHDFLWGDEVAAWNNGDPQDAWDMAMFGLRLGRNPQAIVTTTPRPVPLLRELLRDPMCVVTRGTTQDNADNLAKTFVSKIIAKYEGTRLGRQELDGELIEEVEGALWNRLMIRRAERVPDMKRIVVAIDPATSSHSKSALTGIIVAGVGVDDHGYVLEDLSGRYSPDAWARTAIDAFDRWKADRIIGEGNQGGEMVSHTIQTIRPHAPIKIVHASRGKIARAEPVAALYEQAKIYHAGVFQELEDQLCTWEPLSGKASPDRLDANAWAFTELMVDKTPDILFYG